MGNRPASSTPEVERRGGVRDDVLEADAPGEAAASLLARLTSGSRSALGTVVSGRTIRSSAVEVAWLSAHIAMYPFGLFDERARDHQLHHSLADLSLQRRGLLIHDVEAAGTPIILVHGVVDNRTVFALLKRGLRRRGFGRILTVNYSPLSDDIRAVAKRLDALVERIVHETGFERVHVVGHSMGGLIGRYYVQRMGGDARVHTLVTLGSPHSGTLPATWVPHPIARQMRPNSDVVAEFAEPAPNCRTRFVSVWSDFDLMIVPKRSARVVHPDLIVRNVLVPGVGHMSLPVDGRVVHEICTTLAHLDSEGRVLPAPTSHEGPRAEHSDGECGPKANSARSAAARW